MGVPHMRVGWPAMIFGRRTTPVSQVIFHLGKLPGLVTDEYHPYSQAIQTNHLQGVISKHGY